MDFNRYFRNEELETTLKEWEGQYKTLLSIDTIGKSHEGRPIWVALVTNKETGPDKEKPAVWIDANIHATEIAGTTTSMSIIHALISGYGKDNQATRLLDTSVYYIVPRLNPDGAELALADSPLYIRSSARPYPWDEKEEGLHVQDIDGDGRILQMRIEDPTGEWKVSSLDPRLMEKRKPDEQEGIFYRLLQEGLIEDYDGYQIKVANPYQSLDFNRNFPVEWRPEDEQKGAGPYPTSEPEIKAMVDFIVTHPNINAAIAYHTFSGVILRPPSTHPDEEMDANDLWVYKAIGKRGTDLVGYPNVSVYHDFRYHPKQVIAGVFDDWMYNHLGIFAFTVELWDIISRAGIEERKYIEWLRDHPHEDDHKILKWVDKNAGEDGYVDWYEFDHPQLGKVEIGGWNRMYTWHNPPHNLMEEEAARNIPFALALGNMLPHLEISTLEVNRIEEGTYHINLVVDNSGFFPTYTNNQGQTRKTIRPLRVELEIPEDVEIINGKRKSELGHLEGRSNKIGQIFVLSSPTDNRARIEWVLKATKDSKLIIHIKSERAGMIHKEVTLV